MTVDKLKVIGELIETNKQQFVIPVYQRNYEWGKENCETLFKDIVDAFKENRIHFLGTIVYVKQGEEKEIHRHLIIDGQQRITTIFLFLKALYDACDSENLREGIKDIIFNEDKSQDLGLTEQNKIKLKPIASDDEQFTCLMWNGIDEVEKKDSKIYRNYNRIRSWIEKSELSCKEILSGLKKLTAAVIVLDEEDSPQVVFESINSKGVPLSLADLIRNFILMTDRDQRRLFEQYWLKIEGNIGSSELMPKFITHYLLFACNEDITEKKAYDKFKSLFEKKRCSREDMLKELLRYSKYYKAFLGKSDYSSSVNKSLSAIRSLDQSTIYPFLFHVFDDHKNGIIDDGTLEKVLSFFVSYLLRYIVCGGRSNLMRGLFNPLYKTIFESGEGKKDYKNDDYYDAILQHFWQLKTMTAIPKDLEFKEALLNSDLYKNKKACRFVLEAIANSDENGEEKKETVDCSDYSVEHIMPQNLNNDWKRELGGDYKDVHEQYLHKLGNLSLTRYNSEYGNSPFAEKKEKIIEYKSPMVKLNEDVLAAPVWNKDAIIARGEALSELLLKIFKVEEPKGGINPEKESERQMSFAIGDDFPVTGTTPVSCNFRGEIIPVASWQDLLSKLMQRLYEYDSETIEYLAEQNFKYLSLDKTRWEKRAKEINDTGIYFYVGIGANEIIEFIRAVVDKCQIDSDELEISVEG